MEQGSGRDPAEKHPLAQAADARSCRLEVWGQEQLEQVPRRGSLEQCPPPRRPTQPHTGSACSWLPLLMVGVNTSTPKPRKTISLLLPGNEVPGPSVPCCRYSLCSVMCNIKHNEHIHHLGNVLVKRRGRTLQVRQLLSHNDILSKSFVSSGKSCCQVAGIFCLSPSPWVQMMVLRHRAFRKDLSNATGLGPKLPP